MKISEETKKIVSDPLYDDISKISKQNIIKKDILYNRYYLHTIPTNNNNDLILFYHGSRDTAWAQVLEYTNLVNTAKTNNYIVAFGQSSGIINKPVRKKCESHFFEPVRKARSALFSNRKFIHIMVTHHLENYIGK